MAYKEGSWNTELKAGVFVLILEKLSRLHEDGSVHGDIRLVNLLSTGYIIDFDFVGLEKYPKDLVLITLPTELRKFWLSHNEEWIFRHVHRQ